MIDVHFDRVKKRAQILGNQYQKYITNIETNLDGLMGRLEQAGVMERVHLWITSHDFREEMATVAQGGTTLEEKLSDLSCYFSFQFLQLNLGALDALMLEIMTNENRIDIYKRFMLRVGHDFRNLTASYMKQLLRLYYPEINFLDFVFLGVGTRSDQDDIDLGVVDYGGKVRAPLNRAVGRISSEMLKKAISLHFHLSEHVGSDTSYSASIDEYQALLEREIQDFVIITEMLGAALVVGSRKLYFEFRRKVTARYYYDVNSDTQIFHEGYLRGIVGEARSFMLRELSQDRISPKSDGLRMIKTGLFAAKSIFNLRQINAWAILDELQKRDKRRAALYKDLEEQLTFLEVFRYLYQLLIAQDEEIYIDDRVTRRNLGIVADVMGYESIGAASATDFLLTDYYKTARRAKETIQRFLPYAIGHLRSISIFGKILQKTPVEQSNESGKLARRFLRETAFFRGTRFWDDIIVLFRRENGKMLKKLIRDLWTLEEPERSQIIRGYVDWGWNSFIASFSIILLIQKHKKSLPDPSIFELFNQIFFERIEGTPEEALRISVVFTHNPSLVYEYIALLSENQQRKFYKWLDNDICQHEMLPARDRLQYLLKLRYDTSKYFQRVMDKVLGLHPEYMIHLDDFQHLLLIGKGNLAEVERTLAPRLKLQKLTQYFNFEFFRVGLKALVQKSAISIAMEFTDFSDTYIRLLFDTCKQEIDEQSGGTKKAQDLFGVFLTGGKGQMQAFDDDYDLIILLNSNDSSLIEYCTRIIKRAHQEILKCGILPHYRISEFTGSYLCTFDQLRQLLKNKSEERFIDKSQLLSARLIYGSSVLQRAFFEEILKPEIFQNNRDFIIQMIEEIKSRSRLSALKQKETINIKEDPGGLRDIQILLLIFRSLWHSQEYSNFKMLLRLQMDTQNHSREFQRLYRAYKFLRRMRNLSRLTIAATDTFDRRYAGNLPEYMGIKTKPTANSNQILFSRLAATMRAVARTSNKLIDEVILPELNK